MFMTWGNFRLRKMIWFYYKQRLLTVRICNGSHSQHTKTCMHCTVINYMFIENRSREKKACIWYIHLKSSALTFHGAFSPRVSCCLLYQLYVNVQLRILFFFAFRASVQCLFFPYVRKYILLVEPRYFYLEYHWLYNWIGK